MATRKFSRDTRSPVRPEPVAAQAVVHALPEPILQRLQSLLAALRDIEGSAIVVASALREEKGFIGMYAARMLRTQVSDRLSLEIDRSSTLFAIDQTASQEGEA